MKKPIIATVRILLQLIDRLEDHDLKETIMVANSTEMDNICVEFDNIETAKYLLEHLDPAILNARVVRFESQVKCHDCSGSINIWYELEDK